jgi:rhodanese-related sulfurtransferase
MNYLSNKLPLESRFLIPSKSFFIIFVINKNNYGYQPIRFISIPGGRHMKQKNFYISLAIIAAVSFIALLSGELAYSQETKKIFSIEAYDMLNTVPDTYLIDIRTKAEYEYVGHPNNAYLFPYMLLTEKLVKNGDKYGYKTVKNKDFISELGKAFKKTDNLLILSLDGDMSAIAAKEITSAGFKNVYDIKDGFEGAEFPSYEDADLQKYYRQLAKRNKIEGYQKRRHYGWQWWGLPWTYEIDSKYVYPPDLKASGK